MSFIDIQKTSSNSDTNINAGEPTTTNTVVEKPIKTMEHPMATVGINKSLSDYCISSLKRTKCNQQQLKRRRRFLNGHSQKQSEGSKSKNGNEADDEEKFDETPMPLQASEAVVEIGPVNHNRSSLDEMTSTINTDVSWDGYTDSPFYSNSATAEDVDSEDNSKKIQPILPWDELFFELEPLDDLSQNNVRHKLIISKCSH